MPDSEPRTPSPYEAPRASLDTADDAKRVRWRVLAFGATWVAYAGYYLTRKNFAIAEPAFMHELGWTKTDVGFVISAYSTAYAAGQFVNGVLCDRLGARVMLAFGFTLTALLSFLLGFGDTIALMAILYGLNGFAQSTGWPAVTRVMTHWFTVEERGRVMGAWGTNYPAGDAIATAFASFVLAGFGWRYAFWVPAVVTLGVGMLTVAFVRDHPRDVGLTIGRGPGGTTVPEAPGGAAKAAASTPAAPASGWSAILRHLFDLRVLSVGLAYFCLKFVRYTFVFWIGAYLVERLGFSVAEAGYLQVPFPLFGAAGSIAAGFLSDKVFGARRAPAAAVMLVLLALGLVGFSFLPANAALVTVALAWIGVMTFGPDMLFSTAAAMDFGSEGGAATVTGFVNGMGSIGAAVSGTLVGWVSTEYGWPAVFYVLIAMVVVCTTITLPLWNARGE